jgi:N-acyl-D-amino-acid deacylase
VDLRGQIAAPGFIDVHTHAENVLSLPEAENFARMGVTTIVTGNCGTSAPDVAAFLKEIDTKGASVNVATLVGHNTVRSAAMGGSFNRPPTPEELEKMRAAVAEGMRAGAVGLSTGLIYLPGSFSKTAEIVELAKAAAAHGGLYASHMRNEGARIEEALEELFTVAREARIPAEVSHIKLSGNANWGRADRVLALIDRARAEGLRITQDQYMYTASSTGIGSNLIPDWAREGGRDDYRKRLNDPAAKARIIAEMREALAKRGAKDYAYAVIASYRADRRLNGKSLPEAAKLARGSDSLEDQIELVLEIEANGGAGGVFHGMSEEDLRDFLRHPNTMIASDAGVRRLGEDVPHPRGYGNNARLLARYVRDEKLLALQEGVRRMTALPAESFGFKDRGRLRPGMRADIAVFDLAAVKDPSTFSDPHHYAEGFTHVLVNGKFVLRDGRHTGQKPGRAVRRE